ncbi:signaling protein [Streptomyces sp. NPDC048604]|uniref:phage baseplate protein n=1 Tax=Streptomyces sp. NPDC048604 TaxID=3365578 RepID=UPI003710A77A
MHRPGPRFSRRTLLIGGAAAASLATGVAVGSLLGPDDERRAGDDAPRTPVRPPARVGGFDVARPARLWRPTPLSDVTGPQSLAFDDVNRRVYVAQAVRGRGRDGDLCITRYDFSGRRLGRMSLRGFGHGVSIGVEPAGDRTWLWVESDADRTGYGRAVARVRFRDGAVLDESAAPVRQLRAAPDGSRRVHPAVDMAGGRVLIAYRTDGELRYGLHRIEDLKSGNTSPTQIIENPGILEGETFQGCALYGNYLYLLTGNPYSRPGGRNPEGSGGNTFISAIDVTTGESAGRQRVLVDLDLNYREPEGIAVRLTPEPLLCVGFSVKSPGRRNIALYGFHPHEPHRQ